MVPFFKHHHLIKHWLDEVKITDYVISHDNTVDVHGSVRLKRKMGGLKNFPVKFHHIDGDFDCSENLLVSLVGAPKVVSGSFDCSNNLLASLDGSPRHVAGDFNCSSNVLESLEGLSHEIDGSLMFYLNNISDFKHLGKVGGFLYPIWLVNWNNPSEGVASTIYNVADNHITSVDGLPREYFDKVVGMTFEVSEE